MVTRGAQPAAPTCFVELIPVLNLFVCQPFTALCLFKKAKNFINIPRNAVYIENNNALMVPQ